jgi:VWFA-related protein
MKLRLAAMLLLPFAAFAAAQQNQTNPPAATPAPQSSPTPAIPPPPPAKPVSFSLVIQDKHHHPQTAVDRTELLLLEDSKPQPIQGMILDTERPLLLGLLVDTTKRQEDVLEAERKPDKAFLEKELTRTKDQGFVLHFDKEIELMQDLTSQKGPLGSAIDDLRTGYDEDNSNSSSPDTDDDSGRRKRTGSTHLYDAVFLACDEILRKPDGHKVLVIISDGVDHGSKESMSAAVETAQRTGTVVYAVYAPGLEEKPQQPHQGGGHRSGGGGWPGSGGGGWPGGGGQTGGGNGGGQPGGGSKRPIESHEDGRKILVALTSKTGGRMIETKKKDEIGAALNEIAEDIHSSFLVTYTPSSNSGFHRIGVTVPKHSDWTGQAPEGIFSGH